MMNPPAHTRMAPVVSVRVQVLVAKDPPWQMWAIRGLDGQIKSVADFPGVSVVCMEHSSADPHAS